MTMLSIRGKTLAEIRALIDAKALTREDAIAQLEARAKEAKGWKLVRTTNAIAQLRGTGTIDPQAAFKAALPPAQPKAPSPAKAKADAFEARMTALESAVAQIAQAVAALAAKG
jgi:hypothetical protein